MYTEKGVALPGRSKPKEGKGDDRRCLCLIYEYHFIKGKTVIDITGIDLRRLHEIKTVFENSRLEPKEQ